MPKRVTNHDYPGVTISSDINWLGHVKKIIIRLAEPLAYFKEPHHPAHKMEIYCLQNACSPLT